MAVFLFADIFFLKEYLALLSNIFYNRYRRWTILEVNKEVLKGHIDTLILSLLQCRDMYGYELAKLVREKSEEQFELKEGTLYLSLKRLEKNKWISSYWGDEQGPGGRRKYYKLTPLGEEGFEEKRKEWQFVKKIIDSFLEGGEKYEKN
jgi:DNA-binding PadR family transcriptional regulator